MEVFKRNPDGSFAVPFSPKIDNPKSPKEIEEIAEKEGAKDPEWHVTDIILRHEDAQEMPIPARALCHNGTLDRIHFPNGRKVGWDERMEAARQYVLATLRKKEAPQPQHAKPADPAPKSPEKEAQAPPQPPRKSRSRKGVVGKMRIATAATSSGKKPWTAIIPAAIIAIVAILMVVSALHFNARFKDKAIQERAKEAIAQTRAADLANQQPGTEGPRERNQAIGSNSEKKGGGAARGSSSSETIGSEIP